MAFTNGTTPTDFNKLVLNAIVQKDPKSTQEMLRVIKKYNPQDPTLNAAETPTPPQTPVTAPIDKKRRKEEEGKCTWCLNAPPKKSYQREQAHECPGRFDEEQCPRKRSFKEYRRNKDKERRDRDKKSNWRDKRDKTDKEKTCGYCGKTGHTISVCKFWKSDMQKTVASILKEKTKKRKSKRKRSNDSGYDTEMSDSE